MRPTQKATQCVTFSLVGISEVEKSKVILLSRRRIVTLVGSLSALSPYCKDKHKSREFYTAGIKNYFFSLEENADHRGRAEYADLS